RHRLPPRGQENEFRTLRMKRSRQSLREIDHPWEHPNLARRTRSLGRTLLAGVAAARYRDDAALQIDVIPSQRGGFAMSHAAPKQKEEHGHQYGSFCANHATIASRSSESKGRGLARCVSGQSRRG